jgi:hypothetical protein
LPKGHPSQDVLLSWLGDLGPPNGSSYFVKSFKKPECLFPFLLSGFKGSKLDREDFTHLKVRNGREGIK